MGLKKLDDPSDMLKKIPRQSKYDVGTAEWNPNANKEDLCAISVSWNWASTKHSVAKVWGWEPNETLTGDTGSTL